MPTALVVGAGVGGLASGLALRRAGWDVRVFERAMDVRAVGFGLALAPNAMAALRRLGLKEAIAAETITPTVAEIRRPDGHVIRRFSGDSHNLPPGDRLSFILRPALHAALTDALAAHGVSVETGLSADAFDATDRLVHLRFLDGVTATGDVLIGADGIVSTIRARLHPFEPPAHPSGHFAVRGHSTAIDRLNGVHAFWYLGPGIESGIVQASRTGIYWFQSLLADDVRSGTAEVRDVVARVSARFDAQYRAIVEATAPDAQRLDELFVRQPLDRWGTGRVTLVGDAAHPVLPHTGQGAALALEDGVVLGDALAGATDPVRALRHYEAQRLGPTRRIMAAGPRMAQVTTTRSRALGAIRDATIRAIPVTLLARAFARPEGR
jgi:2-polyprenyl-6-methoxyphenol hydroxylase-like FAD-dependent oxidoreductase